MVSRIAHINYEMINKYCVCHRDFLTKYFDKNTDKPKFRFNFIYDCRNASYTDVMKIILPFVQCHVEFKEAYKQHLFSTVIIINSIKSQQMLSMFIGENKLYNPSRPVHFVHADDLNKSLNEIYGDFVK